MKIAFAQTQFRLGSFNENCKQILDYIKKTKGQADLLVFPEGGLWSYPPKDFLYHKKYYKTQEQKIQQIRKKLPSSLSLLLPGFHLQEKTIQNGVFLLQKNKKISFFAKEFLPNDGVFFESRYFKPGQIKDNVFHLKQKKIQILVCEDFWKVPFLKKSDILIIVNASPYTKEKQVRRFKHLKKLVKKTKLGAVYLNLTGAQDSLIFDGASFALNARGEKAWQADFFKPDFSILSFPLKKATRIKSLGLQAQRERALILGIKEFFNQAGFSKALLGLSGGIDSSLVAYLAVQALGKDNVKAYFLPSRYTEKLSFKIVKHLSQSLKLNVIQKSIDPLFHFCLQNVFDKKLKSLSLQNLQSRLRMIFLMAQSNESSSLLLATGNKSEIATGYTTLYGDLAGALCPIGDLFKTEVYELVQFINKDKKLFPEELILREPSAELDHNQKDSHDLPPYTKLDLLLKSSLNTRNFSDSKIGRRLKNQNFKRSQAPPILKVSGADFGDSWRYPIVHQF